jgi:hypothetical protein
MIDIKKILAQSAGLRAYSIRVGVLNKTKKYFSSKYNIHSNAIKNYEESPVIKSKTTAQKIFESFLCEGINLTESWFYEGIGELPINEDICSKIFYEYEDQESKSCLDILLFKSRYKDSEIITIEDNLNSPYYNYGDHVGFIWRKLSQIDCLNKVVCAVELNDIISVRVCSKLSNSKVRIECNKLQNKTINISSIAPIIFHRPAKSYRIINIRHSIL